MGKKQKKRDAAGGGLGAKLPTITPNAKCKLRLLKLERVKDYLLMEEEFVKNQELLKPHEERNEEDRSKVMMHLLGSGICFSIPQITGSPRSVAVLLWAGPQVDDLRGSPLSVGTLEEIIDEKWVLGTSRAGWNGQQQGVQGSVPHGVVPALTRQPSHPCSASASSDHRALPVALLFCNSHAIVSSTTGPEYYVSIYSFVDKTQLEPGCSVLLHNKVRLRHTRA